MSADVADLQVCLFTTIISVMWPTCIVADDTAQRLKYAAAAVSFADTMTSSISNTKYFVSQCCH